MPAAVLALVDSWTEDHNTFTLIPGWAIAHPEERSFSNRLRVRFGHPLNTLWRAIPRRMNAGHPVAGLYLAQLGHHFPTLWGSHPAAGMEHASSRRIERTGHLSHEGYALSLGVYDRVGYGYGGKQRPGIGVERGRIDRVSLGDLHDVA